MREAAGASGVAAAAVIYGASGEWPKLSLVERVSVGPGEGDGPWTRIGKEVTERTIMHGQNISPSISSFLYVCSSLPLPPFLICVALPPSLSLFSLCVYMWMGVCLLQDILPLAIRKSVSSSTGSSRNDVSDKEASTMLEPVESCSVTFSLNPATGLVVVSEQKGKMVRDRRDEYWFGVQIICSILLLVLLLSSPFLYNFFRERSVKAEHIKWLKSFYLLHAPEVRRSCHSS